MIFGKHINRCYLRYAPLLLIGLLALAAVDYLQLVIPELYQMVINGMNQGYVVVDGAEHALLIGVKQHIAVTRVHAAHLVHALEHGHIYILTQERVMSNFLARCSQNVQKDGPFSQNSALCSPARMSSCCNSASSSSCPAWSSSFWL